MGWPQNMVLHATDRMGSPLPRPMTGVADWDDAATTIVVAEGRLDFLLAADVHQLFDRLAACTGPKSRIALTYFDRDRRRRKRWTRQCEPWLWLLDREGLSAFLAQTNWRIAPVTAGQDRAGADGWQWSNGSDRRQGTDPMTAENPPSRCPMRQERM